MTGPKTNEVVGTRAVLRHYRMSPTKARQVLDLIRGQDVDRAEEILRHTEREAARVVSKVLASAVSNAQHNDQMDPEELYVSACFADEGTTLKRWRPRARGRATRIRKRTCHITVIVSRLPEDRLERRRARSAGAGAQRSRRVAASRRGEDLTTTAGATTPSGDAASTAVTVDDATTTAQSAAGTATEHVGTEPVPGDGDRAQSAEDAAERSELDDQETAGAQSAEDGASHAATEQEPVAEREPGAGDEDGAGRGDDEEKD